MLRSVTMKGDILPEKIVLRRWNRTIFKYNTCSAQNTLSYLTPTVWNNLPTSLKLSNILNCFKHGVKDYFFKKVKKKEQDVFFIKAVSVASTPITNSCLVFGNCLDKNYNIFQMMRFNHTMIFFKLTD